MIPVIVLNWNGLDDTLECMEVLLKQTYSNFHVFLIDNGSEKNDLKTLQENFNNNDKVSIIANAQNLGFTKGNNRVIEMILKDYPDVEYIALLNNDTKVEIEWLSNLVTSAKTNEADIVSSKMINYFNPKKMDNAGHKMLNTAEIIPFGHGEPIENFNSVFENIGSCAGATLYSTKMLRHIGIFDEYFDTGYEDAEIGLRASVLGYKCIFEPSAIVLHKVSQSVNKIRDYEYVLKIQLNIFYTYFKLMPLAVLLINLPSFLFKYGSVFLIDIVFYRPSFLKILSAAFYRTFFKERKKIMASRRGFFNKHKTISSFQILRKQSFFLLFDIRRFIKFVVLRKPTEFER